MAEPITKPVIADAVKDAITKTEGLPTDEKVARAQAIVLTKPTIAKATKPISRFASQTIQGIAAAGAAQLLQVSGFAKSLVIAAGWFGQTWNADEVSQVASTVITIVGLAWAWYGRETTTRPLA